MPFKDKLNRTGHALCGVTGSVICRDQATFSHPQMHLNRENSPAQGGQNIFVKIVSLNKYGKAVQARSVPGEIDTNPSRTGAATSLRIEGDRIKGTRQ